MMTKTEERMMCLENDNKYQCTIEHFLEDEYSICREERQYAVLLYNILRKYHNGDNRAEEGVASIFEACGIPRKAKIQKVFYEATFMRDFFERNRRLTLGKNPEKILLNKTFSPTNDNIGEDMSFNAKLIKYVAEKEKITAISYPDREVNLGYNAVLADSNGLSDKIRCMMNVKPDIAVIYTDEKKEKRLLFLECKFASRESSYKGKNESRDESGNPKKDYYTQSDIQWEIADFLCNHYLKEEGLSLSDAMKNKKSRIVKFVRIQSSKPDEAEIQIKELIRLNDKIFA